MQTVPAPEADEYVRRGWWSADSVGDLLRRRAESQPDGLAYLDDERSWTWRDCDTAADGIAAVLTGLGIERGERVAVFLPDGGLQRSTYVACERAGAVIVGVAARTEVREVAQHVARTGARVLVVRDRHGQGDVSGLLTEIGAQQTSLTHCVIVDGDGAASVQSWEAGPAGVVPVRPLAPSSPGLRPDDVWLLNFTSGTTGLPKVVMQTQNRWFYLAGAASSAARIDGSDVVLSAVPGPYGFGLWTGHVLPVLHGATCCLVERFSPANTLRLIERHRISVLACVTTQLVMMMTDPVFETVDLSSLRVVFTGGEKVPADRAARWELATGSKVLQFYGSNEAGPLSCTSIDDDDVTRLTTAGRVVDGVRWRLLDETQDQDDRGEIVLGQATIKSPAAHGGYWDDPEANGQLYTDEGFMILPDLVAIDREDRVRVVGRKSEIIIRGGRNISVAVVEQAVATHPSVLMAAAVPVPDPTFGERIGVVVALRDQGASLALDDLVAHLLAQGLGKAYLPERLLVVPEIPMSIGGKADKQRIKGLFTAQEQPA